MSKKAEAGETEMNFVLKRESSGKFRVFGMVENEMDAPISDALLTIDESIQKTTDQNGHYEFANLEFESDTTHKIQCSAMGYITQEKEFVAESEEHKFQNVRFESLLGTEVNKLPVGVVFYVVGTLNGAINETIWTYEYQDAELRKLIKRKSSMTDEEGNFKVSFVVPDIEAKILYFICYDGTQAPKITLIRVFAKKKREEA